MKEYMKPSFLRNGFTRQYPKSIRNYLLYLGVGPLIILFLIGTLPGCTTTIEQKPFTAFNEMASRVTEIDGIIAGHYEATKKREFDAIVKDKRKISYLSLAFSDQDPYYHNFKFPENTEPLFIKLERFKAGLSELNSSFIRYTQFLSQLSSGDLIKTEDFETLAESLNTNTRNAMKTLNISADTQDLSLFSTLAAESARQYISHKRKRYLIDIISNNHASVEGVLQHAREAVKSIAVDIRAEYTVSNRAFLNKLASSRATDNKKLATFNYKRSVATGTTLDVLKAVDETYGVLTKKHKELETALKTGQFSIGELAANIERLEKLYDKLQKANEEAAKGK
jgi:hypothetical protein